MTHTGLDGEMPADDEPVDLQDISHIPHAPVKGYARARNFIKDLVTDVKAGVSVEAAKIDAVGKNYPLKTVNGKLRKANKLLEKTPWINRALQEVFADAGLTLPDAASKQVELIQNENPDIAQRGLNQYFKLTIPAPTQRHQVQSMGVVEMITRTDSPVSEARVLDAEDEK